MDEYTRQLELLNQELQDRLSRLETISEATSADKIHKLSDEYGTLPILERLIKDNDIQVSSLMKMAFSKRK